QRLRRARAARGRAGAGRDRRRVRSRGGRHRRALELAPVKAVYVVEGGALEYGDRPDPEAGPGEVVVELKTAAINRRDLLVRNPPGPAYQFPLPIVPGSDGAGVR